MVFRPIAAQYAGRQNHGDAFRMAQRTAHRKKLPEFGEQVN
jgi:hypothetical protein